MVTHWKPKEKSGKFYSFYFSHLAIETLQNHYYYFLNFFSALDKNSPVKKRLVQTYVLLSWHLIKLE